MTEFNFPPLDGSTFVHPHPHGISLSAAVHPLGGGPAYGWHLYKRMHSYSLHLDDIQLPKRNLMVCAGWFRDPVMEICNMLMQHWPLIKPMSFVGQASSTVQVDADMPGPTRGTKGFTQKQQLQVIRRFREGGYNVLVSTCVGEEGLDIGEVDLIVCYDAPHASPLRLVQRMGRTGRKREGRVVTLVTKEIEEQKHRQGLRQKGMMLKSLLSSKVLETSLCRNNARVLPPDAKPSCHMMPMTIPKLLEEGKKKGKKSKAKSGKTITMEDMLNQRPGKDVEENEVNEGDAKETLSKKSKGKGKGKSSKSISKVKPRKGIKEFFSVQKAMVVDTIVLSDEEAEDDDFVGAGVSKVKSKFDECEDGDEIIAMEEDMASPPRSPSSPLIEALSPFKVNCQASPHEVLQISSKVQPVLSDVSAIPCDLLALENTLSVLFVSICCNDSKVDSPYRCSVIKSHFQIRHPVHYSHNMSSNFEIDSITVDALKSFDPEKEAKNIGKWCPKPAITDCENADHSLTRNYGVSSEKNDLFAWNTRSDTTLTSKRHTTLVKNKENFVQEECNKSKGIDIKISNEIRDLEVIDVFDSDEEMACYPTSTKKKPSKTPVDVAATAGEGLLWNVLGRKECRTERVAEINDIGIISDGNVLKKDFFDSKKASCNTLCDKDNLKKREDTSGCDRNSGKIDEVKKFNPPNCSDKILNSPDIIEDGYFGLQERTPTKGSPGVMNVSKDQSYSNADILGQPVLASSTPKVHRKNLFSPKSHLPSPISHHRKKSPGTFEILPAKDNFSESEQHFPYHSRARSPTCLPSGIKQLEKWGRVTTESVEYPKFTLGSEYEFSSSDETIFEPEGDLNLGEANFNSIEIQNSAGKRDIGKALFVGDNSSNKYLQPEQIPGILPHKVEKSSDLFEMTSADASKSMSVKNKHSNVHNGTCDDVYDHSFTITQAVNMLACAKNRPCRREEEDLTDRKEVKLRDQNETHVYHKNTGPHSEGRSLLTNGKSVKKEEVISLKVKEKSLPVNKNVTCLSKESTEEVANVDQVKAADEEINFDIGEDILLDLSADLFAEDNADGDENSDAEPEVGKLGQFLSETKTSAVTTGEEMKPKKVPASIISDEVMKGAEKEVHMKSQSFGNENCVSQPRGELQRPTASNNNENLTGKTRDEFSIPAPVISGWSANGWLSKGSHSSKSKFSLGLKGIKQHMESEGPSMKMDVNKSTDLKTNNLVSDKVAFRSSTSVLSTRRDNQINCETSERTILDAINDLEKKHPCKSPEVHPGKKEISIPSDDSLTCLDFQDIDFVENGADFQLESSFDVQHKHAREESKNVTVRGQKRSKEVDAEVIKVATVQPCVRNSREYKEKSLDKSDLVEHQRKNSSKEFVVDLECDLSDWEVHPEDGHNSGGRNGESSDDDFVGHGTSVSRDKQRSINGQNTTNSSEERAPVKTRRIRRKKNRVFLDTQAEESFVETHGAGSDEEEDDDDVRGLSQYYDPSFINDAGPNSQETEVDMHAKYLQSVRSPRNAKFKIPNCKLLEPHNESEVESEEQSYHQDEPDSCYMNDSFCVDSNSDEKEESVDELEVLEAILANSKKDKNFKRRKKENSGASSDEPLETAVVSKARKVENSDVGHRKKRKRKRIVVHDSSDEEERDSHSPSKKNCKVDEEIAVVDEKLWDEFSQDFVEEPLETNQVGGKSSLRAHEVNISSKIEWIEVSEKYGKRTCDSKLLTKVEQSSEKSVKENGAFYKSSCDSVLGLHERRENSVLGGKSTSVTEIGRKQDARGNECSVNWSDDLFNFSDDEDELFSVIKSPPHSSNSSSVFKVPPVPALSVSSAYLENNGTSELTGSRVNQVISKERASKGISSDDCLSKGEERYVKNEGSIVNQNKSSHFHDSSFLLSKRSLESFQKNNSFHPQKCSSTNESSPDPRREVPSLSKPVNAPTSSHNSPLVTAGGESKTSDELREVLIIVSPMEACRSSEVMSALRVIKGVRLVVYAASGSPSIPYCLGRDLCLLRASSSGLGRNSKMPDAVQAALNLFHKVALIIEWEKESDGATSSWMKKKSNPNSISESVPANYGTSEYVALLNLRSAGVNVLHSYGLVETAKLIADIARHQQGLEMQANMPPPSLPSSFQSSNPALKFYASLPGLNTFQAFSLFLQFPKINDFLLRCKSARSIQMATYLDLNKSLHLQQILANVHFSDT